MFDYEQISWANGYITLDEVTSFQARRFQWCLEHLGVVPVPGAVLEVGCGEGKFIRSIKRHRDQVLACGLDISSTSLRRASYCYPEQVLYQQGNATRLPYPDNSFDAILALDVLEHLIDYKKALTEFGRLLVPGGLLLVAVPCEGQPWTIHNIIKDTPIGKLRSKLHGHVQRFSQAEFLYALRETEFSSIDCYFDLHWLGQLADVLGDLLLNADRYGRAELWGSKTFKAFLADPRLAVYSSLWKLGYYESRVLRKFGFTAVSLLVASVSRQASSWCDCDRKEGGK
jgi:ubiquinone/menaquinone biosynthesis C-methylase UbiE